MEEEVETKVSGSLNGDSGGNGGCIRAGAERAALREDEENRKGATSGDGRVTGQGVVSRK